MSKRAESGNASHEPVPSLKWAGGKRWQLPYLLPYWTRHRERRLVEPFCGGLAVALGLRPQRALLNDINPQLINFYRSAGAGLKIPASLKNNRECFERYRDRFNLLIRKGRDETREAAALFYYLNRTGFNGLCRFNQRGEFNVPFGRHPRITYRREFSEYESLFCSWEFVTGDFERLELNSEDFVYSDPPYSGGSFTAYNKERFGWEEQERLAVWLSRHPGPVIAANHATKEICVLYRKLGFRLRYLSGPRRISCNGNRTPAREVLGLRNMTK